MTYKQIEAGREVRLWIGQVIVPGIILAGTALANPTVRQNVRQCVDNVKSKFKKSKEIGD